MSSLFGFFLVVNVLSAPHILWIVCDDLGYDDLSFTGMGSNVKSPTLSKLASEGTILSNYYVNPICTPTRASFMSGRLPIHLGLQHGVIRDSVPLGLPLSEKLVPEYLKSAGYRTEAIGKWHLGFYQKQYTPEARGFDRHYGYYTGNEEYWNHTSPCWSCGNFTALDLHSSTASHFSAVIDQSMHYSTELFGDEAVSIVKNHKGKTPLFMYLAFEAVHGASSCFARGKSPDCNHPDGDELQAPSRYIMAQDHIEDVDRRTFAGMLGAMDEAVANITAALSAKEMLNETLIVFTTDNGAPFVHFNSSAMSNWPLRGGKATVWEGGVRGSAFVWGPGIGVPAGVNNSKLFHAADWLPTFAGLADAQIPDHVKQKLDGFNIWSALTTAAESPRTEILHALDPLSGDVGLRLGNFKLVRSHNSGGWGPNPSSGETRPTLPTQSDIPSDDFYMFDLSNDPSERLNLIDNPAFSGQKAALFEALDRYNRSAVPCSICTAEPDPKAQPAIVKGLQICTPSPRDPDDPTKGSTPILCQDVGVWQPWQMDEA
mmetsp:Transcript_31375/g.61129  ORF Transcript_31375/g.61129 Transcript_31375/m.61129 type:complete len:543 (+) Transcript_31375:18-1646(+)